MKGAIRQASLEYRWLGRILWRVSKRQTIDVECHCGEPLARYRKGGKGRLVKMFLDRIVVDHVGRFVTEPPLPLHAYVYCPACAARVATVQIVRGRYAAKVNQGAVRVA